MPRTPALEAAARPSGARWRLAIAATVALSPVVPLAARLAKLQVMEHDDLSSRAASEYNRSADVIVPRADILDRNGNILAHSLPSWSCFIDKRMVERPDALAARLAPLTGVPAAEIARACRARGRFATLKKRLSWEQAAAVGRARLEGVGLAPGQERFYPNGDLARGLIGQVSVDGRGVAGLELALDRRLSGKPRRLKVIRDGAGQTIFRGGEQDPAPPEPVSLTIDRNVQFYAEEALAEAVRQFRASGGMAAVEDPATGELLALASVPSDPLHDPLIQDTYEPGSTFKVVAAAAALETASVSEAETFYCENGAYEAVPGVVIHDHEPEGSLTLAGILEHSSNIGIAKVADRLGAATFYKFCRAFGFGSRTGVTLPGETGGELKPLSELGKVGLAAASYGYGVAVSPLQVLSAYSAIANGGTLWEPSLLRDGKRPAKVRRVASERTMSALSRMLEGVVERGTAVTAQIPGYRVAGKTGTARRIDPQTRRYSSSAYNASFVGFLPASRPQWTILVVLENPQGQYYGAQTAAPAFATIARRLLAVRGVAPDRPLPAVARAVATRAPSAPAPLP